MAANYSLGNNYDNMWRPYTSSACRTLPNIFYEVNAIPCRKKLTYLLPFITTGVPEEHPAEETQTEKWDGGM